jgi:hypothetical protein
VGVVLATPLTWTLQNVTFSDGGTATGSFVYDASTETVVSYSISVSGGNTTVFPPFVYQNGGADNTGTSVVSGDGVIDFNTDLESGFHQRFLALPVLPLPASGTQALDLTNPYGAECYDCNPYRTFASGQVVSSAAPSPTTVPVLSRWALAGLAILLLAAGVLLLSRTVKSRYA